MFCRKNPWKLLFSPTEPAAAAATPVAAPAASETPSSTPAASSAASPAASTPAVSTPAPAAGNATAVAGTSTPAVAAPAATPSWLDQFRQAGFQSTETDEAKVRAQLLQAHSDAERLRPLAPQLSAYQQHAKEFHEYLAQRQQQAAKPAQQDWTQQLGWNPPGDFNALRRQVQVDAQGNIVAAPGAAPDAVVKFQAAQAYRQEQTEKFLENPYKFMEPAIKHIAGQLAQEQAQTGVGQYKEQQQAQSFIQEHSNWLFDQDNGKPKTQQVLNPQTGRYESQQVLSGYGKQFVQHLQDAAQQGLSSDAQQKYALQAVQNAYMASPEYIDYVIKQRQATATPAAPAAPTQTPLQQSNAQFAARANPPAAPATVGGNAVPSPQKVTRENMEQIMLARITAAGGTA